MSVSRFVKTTMASLLTDGQRSSGSSGSAARMPLESRPRITLPG